MAKLSLSNLKLLNSSIETICESNGVDAPLNLRAMLLNARRWNKRSEFGLEVDLLVQLTNSLNAEYGTLDSMEEYTDFTVTGLKALKEVSFTDEFKSMNDEDIMYVLDGIRESKGYHCFMAIDDATSEASLIEGVAPDIGELKESLSEVEDWFGIKFDYSKIDAFDESEWIASEKEKKLAVNEEIASHNSEIATLLSGSL